MTVRFRISVCFLLLIAGMAAGARPAAAAFTFASMGDAQEGTSNLLTASQQIASFNPAIVLYNGDLADSDGTTTSTTASSGDRMDLKTGQWKTAGIFDRVFAVRGNHDDHLAGSAATWNTFFSTSPNVKTLPAGVTNYTYLNNDPAYMYLTYSFDYDNSRFIALDENQYAEFTNTSGTLSEYTFLDSRLADAESRGLTHAFLFWHGPEYCVESVHCGCTSATGCYYNSNIQTIINNHKIVSATFHGHEHVQGWVHMDSTRAGLTHSYEEFITSPASADNCSTYVNGIASARMNYYTGCTGIAYTGVDVNGPDFTVKLYRVESGTGKCKQQIACTKNPSTGSTSCTQSACTAVTVTPGPSPTPSRTPTPSPTRTPTPNRTPTPTPTGGSGTNTRITKYYLADRVLSNADFAKLAAWGINTAVVDFKTNGTASSWDSVVNAAAAAGIKLVIWPDAHQGSDVSGCRWETPFDDGTTGGDMLKAVRPILDHLGNNPNVIGIVTAHEPVWVASTDQDRCSENIADMTTIRTLIHDYIDNTVHRNAGYAPFKVWNYIDNIYNMSNLGGYSSTNKKAQIQGIMDVAVIWQHCAGYPTNAGDGSACEGSGQYTALGGINYDRNTMIKANSLEGIVEEVFIIQTFNQGTTGDYGGIFSTADLQKYSCLFLNTGALDGFGYYTWDEGWYTGNLKKYYTQNPAGYDSVLTNINNSCINKGTAVTPTPAPKIGDGNGDGAVNGQDYVVWLSHYGQSLSGSANGDYNGDGAVNGLDYVVWLSNYGK